MTISFGPAWCALAAGLALMTHAMAGGGLELSTTGLGEARFGMDADAIERALGRPLVFNKGHSKAQARKFECSYATLNDVSGVRLRFEGGRFMAVYVDNPTVATRSGLRVGDPERIVIDKLKTDPTYDRHGNHYDESIKEITLGKVQTVGQGAQRKLIGHVIKFTSKQGRVANIEAGEAAWVTLFEQEEVCDE